MVYQEYECADGHLCEVSYEDFAEYESATAPSCDARMEDGSPCGKPMSRIFRNFPTPPR